MITLKIAHILHLFLGVTFIISGISKAFNIHAFSMESLQYAEKQIAKIVHMVVVGYGSTVATGSVL